MAYNAEKQFLHRCISGKKVISLPEVWVENILSQTKSPIPTPPSKVKRSAPNCYILLQ